MSMEYGFFTGGDPRKFSPDSESCSEEELAAHKAACALWNEAEKRGETPTPEMCPSGWLPGGIHVLRAPYGVGVQEYDDDDEKEQP